MAPKLSLAWAMPVGYAQLGASIETYGATRNSLFWVRSNHRHKTSTAMKAVFDVGELVERIVKYVKMFEYEKRIGAWAKATNCLWNTCTIYMHWTEAGLRKEVQEFYDCGSTVSCDEFIEWLSDKDAASEKHVNIIDAHLQMIQGDRFSRYKKVFEEDTGIKSVYLQHDSFGSEISNSPGTKHDCYLSAYLTIPGFHAPMYVSSVEGRIHCMVDELVDPSKLTPTDEQKHKLRAASNTLGVYPYDEDLDDMLSRYPGYGQEIDGELDAYAEIEGEEDNSKPLDDDAKTMLEQLRQTSAAKTEHAVNTRSEYEGNAGDASLLFGTAAESETAGKTVGERKRGKLDKKTNEDGD